MYLLCALGGGGLFVVRLLTQFLGFHGDAADADMLDTDVMHADTDIGFKLLSFQGITAFLMMFGLVGLAFLHQSPFPEIFSLGGAMFAGLMSMFAMAKLFQIFVSIQSSGNIDLENAIGEKGRVYLRIPADGGTGQVEVAVQKRLKIYDARAEDRSEIPTGSNIVVTAVEHPSVLIVRRH